MGRSEEELALGARRVSKAGSTVAFATTILVLAILLGYCAAHNKDIGEEALQACEEWEKNVSICEERVRHQPTELYVTYAQSFKGGGFNNQRQTLQLAIAIAHVLNRTLIVKPLHISKHDTIGPTRPLQTFWNIDALKCYVSVVESHSIDVPALGSVVARYNPKSGVAINEIKRKFAKNSDVSVIIVDVLWAYLPFFFRRSGAGELRNELQGVANNLQLSDQIVKNANILRCSLLKMANLEGEDSYHAVHVRVGDREPKPLLNCTSNPLWKDEGSEFPLNCLWKESGAQVTMADALLQNNKIKDFDTIYVATNKRQHQETVEFVSQIAEVDKSEIKRVDVAIIKAKKLNIIFWEDLLAHTRSILGDEEFLKFSDETLNNGPSYISCIEQLLCTMAKKEYLASFPSSWDEFVVEMRRQSGLEGSDVQFQLFYSKVHNLMRAPPEKKTSAITSLNHVEKHTPKTSGRETEKELIQSILSTMDRSHSMA